VKKWVALFASLLGADLISKALASAYIAPMLPKIFGYPFGGVAIFEVFGISFSLNTVVNSGAAWGFFQGYSGLLFLIRALIIGGLIVHLIFFNKGKTPAFPLWLIVTGAIGNGIDYLVYGHVIDFFHFCFWGHSFAIFNLADCYISLGVIGTLLYSRLAKVRAV